MCYSDEPYYPIMQQLCPADHEQRLDCNHDDYYHTNPQPDSYLATHWNVADSQFLSSVNTIQVVQPIVNLFALAADPALMGPATITITAQLSNAQGILAKVEFFDGPMLLETDTASPYLYTWQGVTSGTYTITVKAYDDMDTLLTSNMLTLVVPEPSVSSINNSEQNNNSEENQSPTSSQLYLPLVIR